MQLTTEALKTKLGTKYDVDVFSNRDSAFKWAASYIHPHAVILGDKNKFWVCTLSDAQKLVKMGYEYAI